MNISKIENPRYLGDGVYGTWNDEASALTITTGSHEIEQADSVIYLEVETIMSLEKFLADIKLAKMKEDHGN